MSNLLVGLFAIPFLAALLSLFLSYSAGKYLKPLAVVASLLPLGLLLYGGFHWIGSSISYDWLPTLSIRFHLSVDALSLVFLYLTAIIIPIALLAVSQDKLTSPGTFYGLILLLQGLLIGFFTSRDLAVFMIFWESILLPLYLIINLWGGDQRRQASLKFLIYMIAGSALMVAAVLALYFAGMASNGSSSFDLDHLASFSETVPYAKWICGIFLLAFAVKTPLFPFHAWLPDVYCQASTSGAILLSALLSKAGIYGILRISLELFPTQMREWSPLLLGLAIAGVFYGGLAAWMQNDFKRLIAYSSLSHVNFILAGLFVWNQTSRTGAILQALNHSVVITGLFLTAGWLTERIGSTRIDRASGLATYFPYLCWITLIFVLSSVALPGTNSFVGELLILFGLFTENPWLAAFLGLIVVLSVIYMLRWMQHVYFETPSPRQANWVDIKAREIGVAVPLILLIFWIGVYPAPLLTLIQSSTEKNDSVATLENLP